MDEIYTDILNIMTKQGQQKIWYMKIGNITKANPIEVDVGQYKLNKDNIIIANGVLERKLKFSYVDRSYPSNVNRTFEATIPSKIKEGKECLLIPTEDGQKWILVDVLGESKEVENMIMKEV